MMKSTPEPHLQPLLHLLRRLETSPARGLSYDEVNVRQGRDGPNEIPPPKRSFWELYIRPIFNWLIIMYLINGAVLVALGEPSLTIITFSMISFNAFLAIVQQLRAQKKMEALQRLAAFTTTVIRNEEKQVVPVRELVLGDIVELTQGDKIPADARILDAVNLQVNEASLTGESSLVQKQAHDFEEGTGLLTLQQRDNTLYLGTFIAIGRCRAVIVATGANTELGKISTTMAATTAPDIPLRKKINNFAKYIAIAVLCLLTARFLINFVWTGLESAWIITWDQTKDLLINSIVNGFNLMPINIPLLTTIILLTGVLGMAKSNVIVRNIAAVESLGRVSVICSDKMGTITQNEMTVRRIWADNHLYDISGQGYSPEGAISEIQDGADQPQTLRMPVDANQSVVLTMLLTCALMNNNATITPGSDNTEVPTGKKGRKSEKPPEKVVYKAIGSPTEVSLLVLGKKVKFDDNVVRTQHQDVFEFSFDSTLKRMSKLYAIGGQHIIYTKGATEIIIALCTSVAIGGQVSNITEEIRAQLLQNVQVYEERGYRILSFAYKEIHSLPQPVESSRETLEKELIYLGFVCIQDPPRSGVFESIAECNQAGIRVVMITGDSPLTGKTIGRDVGLFQEGDSVVEGDQVEVMPLQEIAKVAVFARVSPRHKEIIVKKLQADEKKVVAMTGDGVNDALALHLADVGIAMGKTGTDVAKEAADIILVDDSFNSIVRGVYEGRNLFAKIRSLVYFYVVINLMEGALFFAFGVDPDFELFLYYQTLLLLITSHTFPGFALVLDKKDKSIMQERPRDSEDILTGKLYLTLIVHAVIMALCVFVVYFLCINEIIPLDPMVNLLINAPASARQKATTMMLITIMLVETFAAVSVRRINKSFLRALKEDRSMLFAFLCIFFFGASLMMYSPELQTIFAGAGIVFDLVTLTSLDWLWCILFGVLSLFGIETWKWAFRRNGIHF